MSIEIPHGLIKQVQAAILREVNLSSYDPDDSSLIDQLPSIESSISELDPSPPHLRCKHCNGRLLRGEQSLLCVFCGKLIAQQEAPPEPINFKNTSACSWLLHSLKLDGSEIVKLPVEANDSNRGRNVTEEEVPLSSFLDLEITWNSKLNSLWTESDESSLSLAGVDFDNFLAERKVESVSAVPEEGSPLNVIDDGGGSSDFQVRHDFSSLGNVGHFETALRSTEEDKIGGDSFTGWEASFQSAGSRTSWEESKSVVPVVESSVNLSAHMDAVFGSGNSLFDGKGEENVVSSKTGDWFQDEVIGNVKDGGTTEIANNSSSMSINWIQDDQLQVKNAKAPINETVDAEDESFDDWNDFAGSTGAENPSTKQNDHAEQSEVTAVVEDSGKLENTHSSLTSIAMKAADSKALDEEDDPFDAWNGFASSTSKQDPSSSGSGPAKQFEWNANVRDGKTADSANSSSSMNVDWLQDDQWQTNGNKAPESKTTEVDGDLFDAWNDFTSSSATQDASKRQSGQAKQSEVTATIEDRDMMENANNSANMLWTQEEWSTSTNKKPDIKTVNESDDLFDAWNDFTSLTTGQGSLSKQTEEGKPVEMAANVNNQGITGVSDSSFDWFQGNQLQTSSPTTPDNKTINEGCDPFDTWNDLASSSSAQGLSNKQSVNHMTSVVQTTENNLQDFDSGGFSQLQSFPVSLKDQNGSTEVNGMKSEPSVSDRISDVKTNDGEAAKGKDVSTETTTVSTTGNVETIVSQMHDLSFMLESNLSIPQKQVEFHSFSKG